MFIRRLVTVQNIVRWGFTLSKVGVHIRHIITKGVEGHAPRKKKKFLVKYSAFPVNLTPLSRNNFVLWVEPLYIIFQGGVQTP